MTSSPNKRKLSYKAFVEYSRAVGDAHLSALSGSCSCTYYSESDHAPVHSRRGEWRAFIMDSIKSLRAGATFMQIHWVCTNKVYTHNHAIRIRIMFNTNPQVSWVRVTRSFESIFVWKTSWRRRDMKLPDVDLEQLMEHTQQRVWRGSLALKACRIQEHFERNRRGTAFERHIIVTTVVMHWKL